MFQTRGECLPDMPSGQARTLRIVTAAWIAAVTALLGLALDLSGWGPGDAWIRTSYDSLHSIGGERDVTADSVVIVYLDTASFRSAGLDSARPWPRELHGNLVRRLTAEGARAVVFDILFAGPGATPGADASLAMAIRDNGRVILATEYANATASPGQGLPRTRTGTLEPLSPEIAQAAAGTGFSSLAIDDDFVVRRSLANFRSLTEESLTWAAARLLDLPVVSQAAPEGLNSHWVRYYGPAMTLPHVSLGQALETNGVPRGFFRNKIVFIGARSATAGFNERKDEFRNPFHSWRYRDYFMPGVEVHATEMMNLLRHDWLSRPSRVVEAFILIAAAGFGGLLALFRPLPGGSARRGGRRTRCRCRRHGLRCRGLVSLADTGRSPDSRRPRAFGALAIFGMVPDPPTTRS